MFRKSAIWHPLEELEISEVSRKSPVKLKTEQHKGILIEMRNILPTSLECLWRHLPLSNDFL